MNDQLILFFGSVASFVAGGAAVWLILRRAEPPSNAITEALRTALAQVEEKLHAFELEREKSHAGLKEQIASLAASELELQKETSRLAGALRNSSGVRGRWGEMQLRRVVELAGMQEQCDFTEQTPGDDNRRMRPDMIVHLPHGRRLVVDAKTPLSAYLEASEAAEDEVRKAKRKEHAAQVRAQIVRLGAKSYWEQFADAPEFVVLFLPGENFFSAALAEEPELLEYGSDRKVILATPTTLIAMLKAVAYGWRQQRAEKSVEEIRDLGTELYERLRLMANDIAVLGTHLERTVHAYNRTVGTWETQAMPGARRLHDLGAGAAGEIETSRLVDTPVRMPK